MKAAYIDEPGPPESIIYGDVATPEATGSKVLVKVGAVSLNPVDTYVRGGLLDFEIPYPFVVGCDLAGTVEAVGPEAFTWRSSMSREDSGDGACELVFVQSVEFLNAAS